MVTVSLRLVGLVPFAAENFFCRGGDFSGRAALSAITGVISDYPPLDRTVAKAASSTGFAGDNLAGSPLLPAGEGLLLQLPDQVQWWEQAVEAPAKISERRSAKAMPWTPTGRNKRGQLPQDPTELRLTR